MKNVTKGIFLNAPSEWEKFLELFADNVPVLISYVDTKERYRFNNKLYEDWFGYSRKEAYGKHVKEIRGVEAYNKLKPYLKKALTGKAVAYDNVLYKNSGEKLYVTVKFVPHMDNTNKVQGVFVLVIDITTRKLAEFHLKETEKKFTKLTDSNVIGVSVTDLNGKIYEANDLYLDMLGYTRKDFEKGIINWKVQTPPEFTNIQIKAEREVLATGSAVPYEKEYIRKDGTRIPVLIGNVLLDKASKKILAFILDISKQKELEQRKDEFIALASHELKTPLTSLQLFTQMMGRDIKKKNDKQLDVIFTKMEQQLVKVNKLVSSLLDSSRIEAGKLTYKKQTFSLTKLVKETVHELQPIYGKHNIIIKNSLEVSVRADRERIKQVLSNLLNNAVKYSQKTNKIILTITKEDSHVKVAIKDFGMGIPKSLQNTIFDRYYQITDINKKSTSGLGLGLYLSKEIIQKHKGEIWAESQSGKGSIFYFTLPIVINSNKILH